MLEEQSKTIRRVEYTAPAFWIDTVDLTFDLDPTKTRVLNKMRMRRNPDVAAQALRLDGEDLNLARVMVNGAGTSFKMDGNQLVLENLPEGNDAFDLEIFTTCNPSKNTQLSGLYVSNDSFFTQCEAEGFRRITYFLDRPDVMASYTVTLRADVQQYPVLLSNGNLMEQGLLEEGRHFAKWTDPHKKPCYLFALVAGQLVAREQRITSRSGGDHLLQGLRLESCRSAEPRIENFSIGIMGGFSIIDRRLKSFARAATGVGSALRNQAIECRLIGRVTLMLKQDPLGLRWVLECIQSAVGRFIPAVPP